jgi:hypothetical protein
VNADVEECSRALLDLAVDPSGAPGGSATPTRPSRTSAIDSE